MKIILLILPMGVVRIQHTMEGEGCYGVYLGVYLQIFNLAGDPHKSHDL